MAKEELVWGEGWMKLNMNASEVLSAVGWGLEWENREGLQPKIKNRRLALLHLHFQVDSESTRIQTLNLVFQVNIKEYMPR